MENPPAALALSQRRRARGLVGTVVAVLTPLLAMAVLAVALTPWSCSAEPPIRLSRDIPPGALAPALVLFARRTGLQLVYLSSVASARSTGGAQAGRTASEALAELLAGTELEFEFLNAHTVRIYRPDGGARVPNRALPTAAASLETKGDS